MRKKIRFYRGLIIEIIETLITICLFLEEMGYSARFKIGERGDMRIHARNLKEYSERLREK